MIPAGNICTHRTITLTMVVFLFGFVTCAGEEIVLKNGTSITADRVLEQGSEVSYQIGSTTYKIPRSSIVKIVRSSDAKVTVGSTSTMKVTVETPKADAWLPSVEAGSHEVVSNQTSRSVKPKLDAAPPSEGPQTAEESSLLQKILVDGQVDERALSEIQSNSPPQVAAAATFLAGKFEMQKGNPTSAPEYFDRAFKLAPNQPVLLGWYAAALMKIGKNSEALAAAKEAAEKSPQSAEGLLLLGTAYYNDDKTKEAIAAWKQSLEIRPDASIQKLVAKAQKELDSEENFREQESEHFVVRYDGGHVSVDLQRQILATLESAFRDISHQLDASPSQTIPVILYARKAFFDITEAPSWASGENDGKLRIPVEGLQEMTPKLERILRHELTHTFIAAITRGNCASWLNEGLAQVMEPKSSSPGRAQLANLFQTKGEIPFQALEHHFGGFSDEEAEVAYAESLAAVEYLRSKYGMDDVLAILKAISQGKSTESAVKSRTHFDYEELQKQLGDYLSSSSAAAGSQ